MNLYFIYVYCIYSISLFVFNIIIYMFMISIHYISISLSFNLLIKLQVTMNFISLLYLLIDICISLLFSLINRTVSLRTVGNFCFVTVSLQTNVSYSTGWSPKIPKRPNFRFSPDVWAVPNDKT